MKVLILANNDIGLYQFRKDIIEALLKNNEVSIALPYGERVEDLKQLGCHFIDTPLERRGMNPFKDISLYHLYKKILRESNPDLVITYTIKPNIYGGFACKNMGIPYAVNITGLGTAFEKGGMLKNLVVQLYKRALKKAKIVFFENVGNCNVFTELGIIPKEKTKILNGAGVDTNKFSLVDYPKDSEKLRFLFVGRVMAEKGIDELLTATEHLVKDGYACELSVVGWCEESYESRLEECQKAGWLKFHGFQKDVKPFIADCHCFVLPSWHEGMANTNLESASSGRPVITTNIHGCLESVEDGVTGLLVEKQNAESLYNAMKAMCDKTSEERAEMGRAGRKRMLEIFDKTMVVKETLKGLGV